MSAAVFAPAGLALPDLPPGTQVVRFGTSMELVGALRGQEQAVLISDGLGDVQAIADAIRTNGVEVIEVHASGWDGESHSPLTEACRGVIGGFGPGAVAYALAAF